MKSFIATMAGAGLVLVAGGALAAETTMRCSHQLPPKHHIAQVIDRWAAEVEAQSAGAIDVEVFGANSLRDAKQNIPAVAKGHIECAFSVNFQWGKTVPTMNVTLKPYSVTDKDVLAKWPGSAPAGFLDAKLLEKGVRNAVWLFTTRVSAYTSKGGPLIAPDDFKGVKIRGINSLVDSGLVALGAAPSAMSGSKVYQALSTGVIDAGLTDISAAYSRKYYEVQDHVTVSPLFSVFFHGYVNPAWHDGLSDSNKKALEAAGAKAAGWALESTEASAAEAPDQLRDKGMKVHIHTADEIAAMKAVMGPAFDAAFEEAAGADGKMLLDMISKM
ncbi:MAG: TRAP transporter substrate-binding protein DctP [Rhodospirillales bacterium]|nr:TRAP transporter substrate-binding protein DctP [Rhodospirillales bacterium]MDH3920376.1 TRAP transporter substrate-binding protein DctP [Rhodospirillales bacterium]